MDIEIGTIIDTGYSYLQVLKKIADGYLVLHYEVAHGVYNVLYKTFEEISEGRVCEDDEGLFDSGNIEHIDEFGFCKIKE